MEHLKPGAVLHGFQLEQVQEVGEVNSRVLLFCHQRLGTRLLAIKNQDPNKTFCVAFTTVPADSTGVAHILEHSVLMGSRRYPVRDVFGEINKGGLMTFLNAMTGADTTWYPFATRNMKEYFNIMDVYCDVTLHPLLDPSTFDQEGWHYHLENSGDELQYQGVVFNEMKGAFSDPIRLIFHHIFAGLMPGSTYAHESGGDPRRIPDLNCEGLVNFHRSHYQPGNATIFLYGDAPLEEELRFLDERFLRQYEQTGQRAAILPGGRLEAPLFVRDTYGIEAGEPPRDKTFIAVGAEVGHVGQRRRNHAWQIIANILYNSDASPLKNTILAAGLGKDFGGFFLPNSTPRTMMISYLIGSEAARRDEFLALHRSTLEEMVRQGLDRELVLSELNKYEFDQREEMCKAQRGLNLIGKALPALQHGLDPWAALQVNDLLGEIRQRALEEQYFEGLIRESLLDNPATVVVTLEPDPEQPARILREERERLAAFETGLDVAGREALVRRTMELMQRQNSPNDEASLACLPRLGLGDLRRTLDFHAVTVADLAGRELLVNELPTNGICYLDLGFDCADMPESLLPVLGLFGAIVTEVGTDSRDYVRFAKEINTWSGGFSSSFAAYSRIDQPGLVRPVGWFHLKALSGSLERAMDLAADVLLHASFRDRRRIREIVGREFAWAEHEAQSEGYNLAATRVFSHLGPAGRYHEMVSGITAYRYLKQLAENYEQLEEEFLARLEELRRALFSRRRFLANITAGREDIVRFQRLGQGLLADLPDLACNGATVMGESLPGHEAFATSSEVTYNVLGATIFPQGHGYNGHFEVLRTWLSRDYLWNTVRQQGGAYGCFVQFNRASGNLGLVSYRDPQVSRTFSAYQGIGAAVQELRLGGPALEQLIIGAYSGFDPHQGSAAKGVTARNDYLCGIGPTQKQAWLDEILATGEEDLRAFAPVFAVLAGNDACRGSIGSRARLEGAGELFDSIVEL
ncbi:MAG: peptidase M16 [Desulfobulbaceae bacterium A2]|nr:MAG: peptidase M16 [Desulfobulbaceae bacterium A2]